MRDGLRGARVRPLVNGVPFRRCAVEDEAEYVAAHEQWNDQKGAFAPPGKIVSGRRTAVEHERRELGAQLDDQRVFGIDRLGFFTSPSTVGLCVRTRRRRAARHKECGGGEREHADRLVD